MSDLDPFLHSVDGLLDRIEPAARRSLARAIAMKLRASQAKRIAAQLNPDGTPYAPRRSRLRDRRGSIKRARSGAMFSKLRTARWMKVESSPESAVVTFANQVQHMAQAHQQGLRDKVNRFRSLEVEYPARQLLGLTEAEVAAIEDAVIAHLSGR